MTKYEREYCEWIRLGPCIVCEVGNWDMDKGEWRNTVSHLKTKGSGGEIFNNVVPMCIPCHRAWEDGQKKSKFKYLIKAKDFTQAYKSKIWWDDVRKMQK